MADPTSAEQDTALAIAGEIVAQACQRIAAEKRAYDRGTEDGYEAGFRAAREYEAESWRILLRSRRERASQPAYAELERRRHVLSCQACRRRREGPRPGCDDCEQRDGDTWALPAAGDFDPGVLGTWERIWASWAVTEEEKTQAGLRAHASWQAVRSETHGTQPAWEEL